jgi:hypothetical protein
MSATAWSFWNASILSLAVCAAQPPQGPPTEPPPRRVVAGDHPEEKTIYREMKPGEERIDALLQRIICPPGRPVTFVLKAQDRVVKYEAPRLDAVEYIAHNPKFRGPVSCGGYTPPEHVYLTSKKVNGADRPVAIEFLPR